MYILYGYFINNLYTVIFLFNIEAVQSKFTTATVKEVENAASIWLTKASDRLKNKLS